MALWRLRGYVPDSDDEEDDPLATPDVIENEHRVVHATLDTPAQSSPDPTETTHNNLEQYRDSRKTENSIRDASDIPATFNETNLTRVRSPPESSAQANQGNLERGLSLIQDVLSPSRHASNPKTCDEDDSPLSSPPESLQSDEFESLDKIIFARGHEVELPTEGSPHDISSEHPGTTSLTVDLPTSSTLFRSFRARTAIQQNPYTLERARYIVTCDERDIEPVRYREESPELGMNHHEQETQDIDFEGSCSQLDESLERGIIDMDAPAELLAAEHDSTSAVRSHHRLKSARKDKTGVRELSKTGAEQDGSEADPPLVKTLASGFHLFDLSDSDDERADPDTKTRQDTQLHESMPTPPRTMSTNSASPGHSNLVLEDSSPPPVLTPVLSSATKLRKRSVVYEESDSESVRQHVEPATVISDDEHAESSDSSPEGESQELEVMGKKVRGVLPASFWKVHKARRGNIDRLEPKNNHGEQHMIEKGVAQRMMPSNNTGHYRLHVDLSLSDEESSDEELLRTQMSPQGEVDQGFDEAMEVDLENGVDYMLPPRVRRTFATTSSKMTQKRLIHRMDGSSRTVVSLDSTSDSAERQKADTRPRKRRRLYAPRRTIQVLDGPDFNLVPAKSRPTFLKVAGRHARKRKLTTGLAARQKTFRFDNSQDDADIEAEIKRWEAVHDDDISSAPADDTVQNSKQGDSRSSKQGVTKIAGPSRLLGVGPGSENSTRRPQSSARPSANLLGGQQKLEAMNHALRVTRLRKLLPSMNRSGVGRLADRGDIVRVGQLEETRQSYNRFPSEPKQRRLTVIPRDRADERVRLPTLDTNPTHQRHHDALSKHKRRKRLSNERLRLIRSVPSFNSHEESVDYLSAYSQQPTMAGRMKILTQWHSEYQTAWFHGRDREGKFCISEKTTAAYRHFLATLIQFLTDTLQSLEDFSDTKTLRHFIHRLIPNRQRIGKVNEVGNQMVKLKVEDAIVAKNIFELYVCFYATVPVLAPRPRVLEYKVDFVSAHNMICTIAFEAWTKLFDLHLIDAMLLEDLGNWLRSMLTQLGTRWDSAETTARNEAASAASRVPEAVVRKAIDHNRKGIVDLLQTLFERLVTISRLALTESEWSSVFNTQQCLTFADLLFRLGTTSTHTSELILELLVTVTDRVSVASNELLDSVKRILSTVSGNGDGSNLKLLGSAVACYFNVGHQLVRRRAKSWGHFLSSASSHALDMILDCQNLDYAKSQFYHLLLEADVEHYRMEFRPQVLTHWIKATLGRLTDGDSCVELTLSIYKHENASLKLHELAACLRIEGAELTTAYLAEILSEHRSDIVRHIIRTLSAQAADPEALFLAGGLDEADAVVMLRTIFNTMKTTWTSLSTMPEEQAVYTSLVWSVLDEYRVHPRPDFIIDPWFFNTITFLQRQSSTLELALRMKSTTSEEKAVNVAELLHQEVVAADRSGSLSTLAVTLQTLLLPTTKDRLTTDTQMIRTLHKHAETIQCFATYIYNASHRPSIANTLLSVTIHVLERLELRVDQLDPETTTSLLAACADLFPAMLHALSATTKDSNIEATEIRSRIYKQTGLIFAWSTKFPSLLDEQECLVKVIDATEEVCEIAADEHGPATDDAVKLLKTVMSGALSGEAEVAESTYLQMDESINLTRAF